MSATSTKLLKAGLAALHYSGAARVLAPATRGVGAVLMLHHVRPSRDTGFSPNGLLEITPDFLDSTIREVRQQGFDIVSMDEAAARTAGTVSSRRPFACFTFDDGYRDNRDHALPVLKRHGVPFAVYVTSDFADHKGFLWWLVLERVVARRQFLAVTIDGRTETFRCSSDRERRAAYERIYWAVRRLPETTARAIIARLAQESGIDPLEPCRELAMTWSEVRELAAEPLATIGAHSQTHHALGKLSAHASRQEIAGSVRRIEAELGRPCRHFCYPYGDPGSAGEREFAIAEGLGLTTAVTTRKGFVTAAHASRMTALPRVSLNGDYQRLRYLKALLSGLPFAMLKAVRRPARKPAYPLTGGSGLCIQRTSHPAGSTQASPPTM